MPRLSSLPQKNLLVTGANAAGYDSFTLDNTAYNEGATITATLLGNTIANGTKVNYTVSGISAADLSAGSLTGQLNIVANTASVQWTLSNDSLSEGAETFTVTLDNYDSRGDYTNGLSDSATVNDTSKAIVYNIASFSDTTPNEGTTVNVSYTVTNSTETLYWTVNGTTADFSAVSGSSTAGSSQVIGNDTYYNHSISFNVLNDSTTEGNEAYTFSLRSGSTSGTVRDTQAFTVQDTSKTIAYEITSVSPNPVTEGSAMTINYRVSNSTATLYWDITGDSLPYDFSLGIAGSTTYSSTTVSGNDTWYNHSVTMTALVDGTSEAQEDFGFEVRTGANSPSGTLQASTTISIAANFT